MGYNRENFNRIKQEYEEKYVRAREQADKRRFQLHAAIPELKSIDRRLEATGIQIMGIICSGAIDADAKIRQLRANNEQLIEERKRILESRGYATDYTDIKYECEKCGDSGYVGIKMCDCMKKKLIVAGYESSGMSKLMRDQTFDNFSLDYYRSSRENHEKMSRVYSIIKSRAESFNLNESCNIAMFGGTGLGKTHLSSAFAGRLIERGFDVLYTSAVGMISDFENRRFGNGQNADSGNADRYTECELLIIDDLGTEVTNQFTVSCIYNVINSRLNKKLSTVISTNLSPTEFRQRYWDRITSRVFGEYMVLLFGGIDIRSQKIK